MVVLYFRSVFIVGAWPAGMSLPCSAVIFAPPLSLRATYS
jgi:hypothetical protein